MKLDRNPLFNQRGCSEPAKELVERANTDGIKSDLSIRLDGEEVAVVKGAFLEIEDKDIFLVAVYGTYFDLGIALKL